MASVTRSTRRGEPGHQQQRRTALQKKGGDDNSTNAVTMHSRTAVLHQAASGGGGAGGRSGRTKRGLEDRDVEPIKSKRSRFSVDVVAKPRVITPPAETAAPAIGPAAKPTTTTTTTTTISDTTNAAPNTNEPNTAATVANETTAKRQPNNRLSKNDNATTGTQAKKAPSTTKKESKVANGLRHELDRLQPQPSDTKQGGRKLRSQEVTKFKSELALYFPDYDEVIGNEERQQFMLNVDTPIIVTDANNVSNNFHEPNAALDLQQLPFNINDINRPRGYGDELFTSVLGSQVMNLGFFEPQLKLQLPDDPLPDSLFLPIHKRAERGERSLRNGERIRSQHDKARVVQLLEGLQSHDWLKVMGVSGVTETKKKDYLPARNHFIKGCEGILEKFRNWAQEEKRRKQEKARALAEQASSRASSTSSGAGDDSEEDEEEESGEEEASTRGQSESSSPTKQLREEAMNRSKLSKRVTKPQGSRKLPPPKPAPPPREFKSFFSKRFERDAALAPRNRVHGRRGARKVLAWGQPIPEIAEADFMLPADLRDEETLRLRARKKRREKRSSGA